MPELIRHKRSATASVVPTTAQLSLGEIAINTHDGLIFFKKSVSGVESIVTLPSASAAPSYALRMFHGG